MSSRSWERKVRKNQSQLVKARKKQGIKAPLPGAAKEDRYRGRSIAAPILLILFITLYVILAASSPDFVPSSMFYVTIALYVLLAVFFFLRRPYIAVGKDYVQTRKFTGDKRLAVAAIKGITIQSGYVVIEQQKGGNWVFSRLINRYPTVEIGERLEQFAKANGIAFQQK
ncbi:hypothetical protein [Paenibacillus sp. NPDC058071]|uniref:hypothetical protein n=1 Tax=Paenibacillus sp. NPDC058071 TaxID=3346326 RepID=UPI0036DA0202